MVAVIEVTEAGRALRFSFEDLMLFHGGGSPGGVAVAFKVMERVLPVLAAGSVCERREIHVRTAFPGPGARDAFEMATRAVSDDRYLVDGALRTPERGAALERFVFALTYRDATVTASLREGSVTEEFASLAFAGERTDEQDQRLEILKGELAQRVMTAEAAAVLDLG
jgi:hypothetical protein